MKTHTLYHDQRGGWSTELPAALDSEQTLVLVFGAAGSSNTGGPLDELVATFPRSHVLGCSTAGEIHQGRVRDGSLSVAVARFEKTRLVSASAQVLDANDSASAGQTLAKDLNRSQLRGVFVLSDGLNVNGSELTATLTEGLPAGVPVTGGLAGDGIAFEKTWVLVDGKPASNHVTAVAMYGDHVVVGHGSGGGWDAFGPERIVTRSKGNVLYELDGRPALELYKRYLGDLAKELPATGLYFPLALRTPNGCEAQVVRTVLSVDEDHQSMTFAGDIPENHLAQFMHTGSDRLVGGAEDAAEEATAALTEPGLAIAISCVGRRLVLGERSDDELEATLHMFPEGTHQVGFYSYGEFSPSQDGAGTLHNQTMTLTTICEVP